MREKKFFLNFLKKGLFYDAWADRLWTKFKKGIKRFFIYLWKIKKEKYYGKFNWKKI